MKRVPLPCDYPITMSNGGKYYIDELVGEGGFSLVYNAHTEGGKAKVVLKEFFPAEYACRDLEPSSPTYNKVIPISDEYRELFRKNKNMFNESEGKFGGELLLESSQVVAFSQAGDGYAILPRFSKDMYTILDLVKYWENNPLKNGSAGNEDVARIAYSLKIIDSILDVIATFHSNELLHLDLTATNILFATKDIEMGRNGRAYLIDFGSSVKMNNGIYFSEGKMSYSEGYSAPEIFNSNVITVKTDLYSIGAILYLLFVGKKATIDWKLQEITKQDIKYEIGDLRISQNLKGKLMQILEKSCTARLEERFESVEAMQKSIQKILADIVAQKEREVMHTVDITVQSPVNCQIIWENSVVAIIDNNVVNATTFPLNISDIVTLSIEARGFKREIKLDTFGKSSVTCNIAILLSKEEIKNSYNREDALRRIHDGKASIYSFVQLEETGQEEDISILESVLLRLNDDDIAAFCVKALGTLALKYKNYTSKLIIAQCYKKVLNKSKYGHFYTEAIEKLTASRLVEKNKAIRPVSFEMLTTLGLSPLDISRRLVENDKKLYSNSNVIVRTSEQWEKHAGDAEQWAGFLSCYPDSFGYLINEAQEIIGNFSFLAVTEEQRIKAENGTVIEADFNLSNTEFMMFEGEYDGYILNFSVNEDYFSVNSYNILFEYFLARLEKFAMQGVYFKRWYADVFRPDHEALYRRIGFKEKCKNGSGTMYLLDIVKDGYPKGLWENNSNLKTMYNEKFERK